MKKSVFYILLTILIPILISGCSGDSGTSLDSEINNYTKYADYEPVKQDPVEIQRGTNGNILIAYFSRSGNAVVEENIDTVSSATFSVNQENKTVGNAEQIANWIQEATGGDLLLIQTEYSYPFDEEEAVEVGEGQDKDNIIPNLISNVDNISQYNTLFLVYPIWHYTLPAPVKSFLEDTDFSGKHIYAFAANAGSRFADTIEVIKEYEPNAVVNEGLSVSVSEINDSKQSVEDKAKALVETTN